jgi:hypothetical protein
MYLYKVIIILGIVFCIVLLIHNFYKKNYSVLVKALISSIVMNLVTIFCVFSYAFGKLLANYFFLIAFFVIIVLQYLKVFLAYKKVNR